MGVSSTILYGNCIEKNQPVSGTGHHKVVLKGKYKGQKSSFTLDEDILSKHKLPFHSNTQSKYLPAWHDLIPLRVCSHVCI